MNLDNTKSIHHSIVDPERPGEILNKPRMQWPKGNQKAIWTNLDQELTFTLTKNLKILIRQQTIFLNSFVKLFMTFDLSSLAQK